ncbi:MAG: glycosyltransferase family 39 protein [Bdellovibrionota bacterium]
MIRIFAKIAPALVCLFAAFALFYNLDSAPVAEWDESRYGVNAFEMNKRGDFVNYFFNGEVDVWNAKPPLQVWLITAASKVFGFNAFSMRLPSVFGAIVTLVFLFLIGKNFGGAGLGWLLVSAAVVCKALIGHHVGRTGEMDALFLAGLSIFSYGFIKALEAGKLIDWILVGLGLSVSFMAKGFAFVIVGPACLILFAVSAWRQHLRSAKMWVAPAVLIVVVAAWTLIYRHWGKSAETDFHGNTALQVMVFHDLWARFTGTLDGKESVPLQPLQIFRYMDVRLSAVSLLGFVGILFSTYFHFAKRPVLVASLVFRNDVQRRKAVLFSAAFSGSILFVVALTRQASDWYVAPIVISWPLLALACWDYVASRSSLVGRKVIVAFAGVCLIVNLVQTVRYVYESDAPTTIQTFVSQHQAELQKADLLMSDQQMRQDELLYFLWSGAGAVRDGKLVRPHDANYALACEAGVCRFTAE